MRKLTIKRRPSRRRLRSQRRLLFAVAAIFFILGIFLYVNPDFGLINTDNIVSAQVSRVIDGDTLMLVNGERVRLIGINTPEMGFAGTAYQGGATDATAFVRSLLNYPTSQNPAAVWLEKEYPYTDRFGRLRRYVWLNEPTNPNSPRQIQAYQLNAILLANGLAEISTIHPMRNEAVFREISR